MHEERAVYNKLIKVRGEFLERGRSYAGHDNRFADVFIRRDGLVVDEKKKQRNPSSVRTIRLLT